MTTEGIGVCNALSWRGANDQLFEPGIQDYEFPQTTEELEWMRRWLAQIAARSSQSPQLCFLEPELKLEFRSAEPGRYHFSVVLKWGFSRTSDDPPSHIDLAVSDAELSASLGRLNEAIERFLGRGRIAQVNKQLGP